jgi:putative zinc finger protein
MLTLTCDIVRAKLSAYHDEELPFGERIAISDHLENCPSCALEASDLMEMSEALRVAGRTVEVGWTPSLGRLQSDILQRLEAEENASLGRRMRELVDDPRRASASVGVSLAASLGLAICALVMAQAPARDPESLKAVMSQQVRLTDIYLPEDLLELPRADAEAVMPAAVMNLDAGYDAVSAFSALVTPDGHLADLELLGEESRGRHNPPATHEQLSALLNAAATARFAPARVAGSPVPLNVVWLVTHRTVRPPVIARVIVHIDGFRL